MTENVARMRRSLTEKPQATTQQTISNIHVETEQKQLSKIDHLHIKKARCDKFILNSKSVRTDEAPICCCGKTLANHVESVQQNYIANGSSKETWSPDTCTVEDGHTDAYGEMKFLDSDDNIAKYIRVHYKTPIDDIINFLITHWQLKPPKLLISVTGGAQRFSLKPRLKDVFRKGLVKAAVSTGAWISTGGFNSGVMKHVGEAIYEYAPTLNADEKIVVLGIAPWTMVANNTSLIKDSKYESPNEVVSYSLSINDLDKTRIKIPLDPNHSHFILVDNAHEKYGGEIDFRGELESHICRSTNNEAESIPMVVLVLEGGIGTILTVLASVQNGSPCVFVEGSGKCADIFAFAVNYIQEREREREHMTTGTPDAGATATASASASASVSGENLNLIDEKLENELRFRVIKEWGGDKDVNNFVDKIKKTLQYQNLLTVFRMDSPEHGVSHEIDIAILTALLKAKADPKAQLKLALTWNRVDIAKNYIFNQDVTWKSGELDDIMYQAINDDKFEFVNLLLDNNFNLKTFLTNRCLLKLYNDSFYSDKTGKLSLLYMMLLKNTPENLINETNEYDFKSIGKVIQQLIDDTYEPMFTKPPYSQIRNVKQILKETNQYGKALPGVVEKAFAVNSLMNADIDLEEYCKNPEQHLFMYCVLQLKPEMAKLFWHQGYNGVYLAVIASKIFKNYAIEFEENEEELIDLANEFEDLSVKVLNKCYDYNEEKTQYLLIKENKDFSDSTVLQIAVAANDLNVVAHACTQGLLTQLWYHKMVPDVSWFFVKIIISLMCPPLAPFLITFKEDRRHNAAEIRDDKSQTPPPEVANNDNLKKAQQIFQKVDFMDSGRTLGYFEKINHFLKTPFIKFIYNQIFYIQFLFLFSYIMLCNFFPFTQPNFVYTSSINLISDLSLVISIPEVVLIIWVTAFVLDKIQQFNDFDSKLFQAKFRYFTHDMWTMIEVLAIFLFYIGMILRFIPNNSDTYLASRIVLCIDVIAWYLKAMKYYTVFKNLGPKLVMIKRMMYELMQFVLIFIVFWFAFGVSTQALMFHNQVLDYDLLKNVFNPAFWAIGGEYFTRDLIMSTNGGVITPCVQANGTQVSADIYAQQTDCPEYNGAQVTMVIYVIYLIILDILLVNLLIAIFTYTFQIIQNDTDKIWKSQRYTLIYEYFHKPLLVPPLVLISFAISLIKFLLKPLTKSCLKDPQWISSSYKRLFMYMFNESKTGFRIKLPPQEEQAIVKLEAYLIDEFMDQMEAKLKETQDYKLQQALEKVEHLKEQIESSEFKIDEILTILKDQYGGGRSNSKLSDININNNATYNSGKKNIRKNSASGGQSTRSVGLSDITPVDATQSTKP